MQKSMTAWKNCPNRYDINSVRNNWTLLYEQRFTFFKQTWKMLHYHLF